MSPERLLKPSEVADRLSVTPEWVRAHSSARENPRHPVIPCVKLGKSVRFRDEDINAFIQQCRELAGRRAC